MAIKKKAVFFLCVFINFSMKTNAEVVYQSNTCISSSELQNRDFNLDNVTINGACINENSTKAHIILEAPEGQVITYTVSSDSQNEALADFLIKSNFEKKIFDFDLAMSGSYSSQNLAKIATALNTNNKIKLIEYIKKFNLRSHMKVQHYIPEGTVIYNSNIMDYSFSVRFNSAGEYTNLIQTFHFNNGRRDRAYIQAKINSYSTVEEINQRVIEAFNRSPRKERYSFIIKD